jgi:hypothetical protein
MGYDDMKISLSVAILCLGLAACSQTSNDVAPDAGMQGMEQQSPTGISGQSAGTSNVINHAR